MKQLQRLLFILSCMFFLPLAQEIRQDMSLSKVSDHQELIVPTRHGQHLQVCPNPHYRDSLPQRFSYRNRALNDYNEHLFFVSSIRVKPLFFYIHPRYKGYTESYISVSFVISDWRGPPVA